MTVRILNLDVRAGLKQLASEGFKARVCVTSPPYYGLRTYGVEGQLGLEPDWREYIANMVEVFSLVRDVLADDGTLWLNIGDSYNGYMANQRGTGLETARQSSRPYIEPGAGLRSASLKPKDLMLIPERLAIALQESGWWIRSRIIWHKLSAMPESVRDRPTKAYEHIWLLSKQERYFYDAEAASEPVTDSTIARLSQGVLNQIGSLRANGGDERPMKAGGRSRRDSFKRECKEDAIPGQPAKQHREGRDEDTWDTSRRNWRDVWSLGPEPFRDAHFATFPTEIPRRAIVAGSQVGDWVLDPFLGSGTSALVADRLQRHCVGLELNPAYAEMARRRIHGDSPLFAEVA